MFAYLDTLDDVLATSVTEYTLEQAQAIIPEIDSIIANAPDGLVSKGETTAKQPSYWHRHTSGDGTSISDYTEVPVTYKYTYSVSGDTANGIVSVERLTEEIEGSAIAEELLHIHVMGDVLDTIFDASLTSGDETTLDGLVGGHNGAIVRSLKTVALDPPLEPVVPGASKVIANDRPAIEIASDVTGWAAEWSIWPLEQFSQAEMRLCVRFVLKETGTGSNVRIAGRIKGQGLGEDSSSDFVDTRFVIVPVTFTTIGEVFQATIWLDASSFKQSDSLALQIGRDGGNELGSGTNDDVSAAVQIISVCMKGR